MIKDRRIPADAPWHWTDDTAMALAIVRVLHEDGEIRPAWPASPRPGSTRASLFPTGR